MKAMSEDVIVQGLNNIFDLFQPNRAVDPKFLCLETLQRVKQPDQSLLTIFTYTTIQIFYTG